jgi:hypothetical protein
LKYLKVIAIEKLINDYAGFAGLSVNVDDAKRANSVAVVQEF